MTIHDNVLQTVGDTPLVALRRFQPSGALIAAKLEFFNPGASVKDRIGLALIEAGEREGRLQPGGTIVEPTSGNTGIGLAMAAALKGYRLVCTATEKITREKVALLEALGAEVVTCPTDVEPDDPRSYYKVAERLAEQPNSYLPYQYFNPANPEAHYRTTGPEIWKQTEGRVTHWVAGIGTGGTISGTGRYLKERNPELRVIGVDPQGSIYAHFRRHGEFPPPGQIHPYEIDGIGEDMMPETVWWDYIDDVITIDDRTAYATTLELARKEALFCGSSSGAAAAGARQIAADLPSESLVVTLFPDSGERALSKLNRDWMRDRGLIDESES
jgi:cystathionine beta-synthase